MTFRDLMILEKKINPNLARHEINQPRTGEVNDKEKNNQGISLDFFTKSNLIYWRKFLKFVNGSS